MTQEIKTHTYGKDYFNGEGYDFYADFPAHRLRAEKLVAVTNPRDVLDVGCAYGYIVYYLLRMHVYAFGIDISTYAEEMAKNIIPGHFLWHDARQPLPFPDKSFDVIYCEGMLEHIEEECIEKIMAEFDRVAYRRYLQVSFAHHPNVEKEYGHVCIKDINWWIDKIPPHTYLAMGGTGTEENNNWFYKG